MTDSGTPIKDGLLADATFIASPNHDARPAGEYIRLIVLHSISLPPGRFGGDAVERLFMNQLDPAAHPGFGKISGLRVSAHLFVRRDGSVVQFVPFGERAWHAGVSCWRGRECCNDFSIGIELEGCDDLPFAEAQYGVLARLLHWLMRRWPIEQIVGHCDIAPGRKTDPGPFFDWRRLDELLDERVARMQR